MTAVPSSMHHPPPVQCFRFAPPQTVFVPLGIGMRLSVLQKETDAGQSSRFHQKFQGARRSVGVSRRWSSTFGACDPEAGISLLTLLKPMSLDFSRKH